MRQPVLDLEQHSEDKLHKDQYIKQLRRRNSAALQTSAPTPSVFPPPSHKEHKRQINVTRLTKYTGQSAKPNGTPPISKNQRNT